MCVSCTYLQNIYTYIYSTYYVYKNFLKNSMKRVQLISTLFFLQISIVRPKKFNNLFMADKSSHINLF